MKISTFKFPHFTFKKELFAEIRYVLTTSSIIAKSNLNAKTLGTWKIVVAPADSILVKIVHKKIWSIHTVQFI